ncbi:MAG TPA: hypothetical protein VME45_02515 [Stellaceae bacterium]|nr:hypothetical protein [Stellaceae bacterium]
MSDFDRKPTQEIIPPGAPLPRNQDRDRGVWRSGDIHRTHYVYSTRVGPVGAALLALGLGAVAVMGLLFLLSAAFVGLAVVGAVTVAVLASRILRLFNQPLR